jgi:hypothetical protein
MSELCSAAIILSVVNVKEGSLSLTQKWKRPIWSLILFNLRMYLMLFFRHNSPIGSERFKRTLFVSHVIIVKLKI